MVAQNGTGWRISVSCVQLRVMRVGAVRAHAARAGRGMTGFDHLIQNLLHKEISLTSQSVLDGFRGAAPVPRERPRCSIQKVG